MKFGGNPSCGSRADKCGYTHRRTDIPQLLGAFHVYAKAPKIIKNVHRLQTFTVGPNNEYGGHVESFLHPSALRTEVSVPCVTISSLTDQPLSCVSATEMSSNDGASV